MYVVLPFWSLMRGESHPHHLIREVQNMVDLRTVKRTVMYLLTP